MARKKKAVVAALVAAFGLLSAGCKKTPMTATVKTGNPTILIVCSPASAGPDAIITAGVAVAGSDEEIRVFGLDLNFDGGMLEFQSAGSGTLTTGWAGVDGNEISPGLLRVGGFAGGASGIAGGSQGTLAEIRFRVTGPGYGNGQQSQVCIGQYTDDIVSFLPQSTCFAFTLKK